MSTTVNTIATGISNSRLNPEVIVSLKKKNYKVTPLTMPAKRKTAKFTHGLISGMTDMSFFKYAKDLNHRSRETQFLITEA